MILPVVFPSIMFKDGLLDKIKIYILAEDKARAEKLHAKLDKKFKDGNDANRFVNG